MAYTTSHSFSIQQSGGGELIDMADLGISLIGGRWPFIPEPVAHTINMPAMEGGYTYIDEAGPSSWTMRVILDCEEADMETLFQALDAFEEATEPTQLYKIYLDGVDDRYWLGRRISGVSGEPVGQRAIEFDIVWMLDSPRPTMIEGT